MKKFSPLIQQQQQTRAKGLIQQSVPLSIKVK
jgi:hypothetical protein